VRRYLLCLGLGVLSLGMAPGFPTHAPLAAQNISGDCRLMDTFRSLTRREVIPGFSVVWISRADLRCPNGVTIRADSAVVFEQSGRNELIGNVRFVRDGQVLTASTADWFEREGRLFARGNVILRDPEDGTELRGDTLVFLEPRLGGESQVTGTGRRPRAIIPVGDESTEAPYEIEARQIRLQGERFFWADGDVTLDREDLIARADSLVHDRDDGTLILRVNAEVIREDVRATGEVLNIELEDGVLRGLTARNPGRIETEDGYALTGLEVIVVLTADGSIESLRARGGTEEESETFYRASIRSGDLLLEGDREVDLGEEDRVAGLRTLTSTGRARVEALEGAFGDRPEGSVVDRRPADQPQELPDDPAGDDRVEDPLDRDWLEGESIEVILERVPPTEPDGEERWRLLRLRAENNARALYRQPDEEDEPATAGAIAVEVPEVTPPGEVLPGPARLAPVRRMAISYILADLIILHMESGAVQFLEAEGNVRGLQLEPQRETGR
jgi:lipopolysaccharide export system protein LptA